MGQQQILLIVLAIILVSIAAAVGIQMFKSQVEQSNLDAIVSDLNNFGAVAHQYCLKPKSLGGGAGTFIDFSKHFVLLAENITEEGSGPVIRNSNATYTLTKEEDSELVINAVSTHNATVKRSVVVCRNGETSLIIPED